jgi:transposase
MPKKYQINAEQRAELEAARKKNTNKNVERRIRALLMRADGTKYKEIGVICEYHPAYVSMMVSTYCRQGLSAIAENHYHGNHRNLTFEEEEALLNPFRQAAEAGRIIEVNEIKKAYEKAAGRSLENTHGLIYCVLKRHGWRKIMPRSKHPSKANDEAIEASKKLNPNTEMQWNYIPNMGSMSD